MKEQDPIDICMFMYEGEPCVLDNMAAEIFCMETDKFNTMALSSGALTNTESTYVKQLKSESDIALDECDHGRKALESLKSGKNVYLYHILALAYLCTKETPKYTRAIIDMMFATMASCEPSEPIE